MLQAARYRYGQRTEFKTNPWHHLECQYQPCGQFFDAVRRDAKYCSAQCRMDAHRAYKRSPSYLLRKRPYDLHRYWMLNEISPTSAATVARCLSAFGIEWGIEIMVACLLATGQISVINAKANDMLRAASNTSDTTDRFADGK